MIVHCNQRHSHDCAAACLAMLTSSSYEDVEATMPGGFASHGLGSADLAEWMTGWSGVEWRYRRYRPYVRWNEMELRGWPRSSHAASIREGERGPCHVVVVSGGRVYDPEMDKPWPLTLYERSGFHLIGVIGRRDVLDAASKVVSGTRRRLAAIDRGID